MHPICAKKYGIGCRSYDQDLQIPENETLHYQGVLIVNELMAYRPDWLAQQPDVLNCLVDLWRAPERFGQMRYQDQQGMMTTRETLRLANLFVAYLRSDPYNVDLVFDLVALFVQESVIDLSFVQRFFLEDVATKYTATQEAQTSRKVFAALLGSRFLAPPQDDDATSSDRPMLLVSLVREDYTDILDAKMMEKLDQNIWANSAFNSSEDGPDIDDPMRRAAPVDGDDCTICSPFAGRSTQRGDQVWLELPASRRRYEQTSSLRAHCPLYCRVRYATQDLYPNLCGVAARSLV